MSNWFYITMFLQQFIAGVWSIKKGYPVWGFLLIQYGITNLTLLFLQKGAN